MVEHITWPTDARKSRVDLFLLCSAIIAIGAFLVNQVYDLDVWWQVTIGNDILNRLVIPTHDHFATAALGRPYHDSHWLFQVVLAGAHRTAGMVGVELVMIVLWTATLYFCYRAIRHRLSPTLGYPLLFLAAMASIERFLPRPEIVSFLMLALFYLRLQEGKYKSLPELAVFGLLQVVWANCHGLFVLGPFMVGCYWFVSLIRPARGGKSVFPALTRLLAVLMVATVATPFGPRGWQYAVLLFREAGVTSAIALNKVGELSPTFGAAARSAPAFWFFVVLLAAVVVTSTVLLFQRRLSPERLILVAGMAAAAITGRRNMALFALVSAPLLAEHLDILIPSKVKTSRVIALPAIVIMLAWAWFPLSGRYYLMTEIPSRFGWGATSSFFPHGLPGFLDRIGFKGQILNSNTLGGFYLYHGYPQRLPLTDGRWEIYDRQALDSILRPARSLDLWQQLISTYDIRGILLQHASPEARTLLPVLPHDPQWRLVYYDHAASFWMRTDTAGLPPAIDLSTRAVLPPRPARVDDCLILDLFLGQAGATELRLQNLVRAASFGWQAEQLLTGIGLQQMQLGRLQEAEQTFLLLSRKYPRNTVALNELAYLAYRRGDLAVAESLLGEALKITPDDANATANIQRIRASRHFQGGS